VAKESELHMSMPEPYWEEPGWSSMRRAEPPHVHDRLANTLQMGGFCTALLGVLSAVATFCAALEIGGPWSVVYTLGFAVAGTLLAMGAAVSLLGVGRDKLVQRRAREAFNRG
jgi:hypothetical protein